MAVAGAIVLSASASAQEEESLRNRDRTFDASRNIAADLQRAQIHDGPLYFLSQLRLSDIGYNQDFFMPVGNGSGVSFGVAAPQRIFFVPTKKTVYSLEYTPEYNIIHSAGSSHQYNYNARGDAQFITNYVYADVYGRRADEIRASAAELNRFITERETAVGISGEFRYSTRTSATFSAETRALNHPLSEFQPADRNVLLLDRSEHNYRLALRHKTFPLTSLYAVGEASTYSFPFATYKAGRRTFAGLGATRDSGRTYLRVEAGPGRLNFRDPSQHDFHGVLGNGSASYRATSRTTLGAAAARDVAFSIFADNNYYVVDQASLNANYAATRNLAFTATSTYMIDRYDVPTLIPTYTALSHRRDRFTFTSVGWRYTIRRFTGGFDVGYYDRYSNLVSGSEHGIRLVLHLSLVP
jgi:hypothetical protein